MAGERPSSARGGVLATAGAYAFAAAAVAGAVLVICLLVFVFTHGRDRLASPLVPRPAPAGDLTALAEALARPAGVAFVLLGAVSAILARAGRRRCEG